MSSSDHGSSCPCCHEEESVRFVLLRIILGGFFVLISILAELAILNPPEIAIVTSLIALLLTAYPILKEAILGLIHGERNVCELASIAIVAAVLIGEFTAAAEVAVILTIGELAEKYAYARTQRDIEGMITRNPRSGFVLKNGEVVQVPVQDIALGDQVVVRPGDLVPVDGTIRSGTSSLDESCLTGESLPIEKKSGDPVFAGSINMEGTLILDVDAISRDSTYSRIVDLVREAGMRRPPSQPFIDKLSRIYSPLMLLVAGVVLVLTGNVVRAITVLIVACPCALLLATPSALLAALGSAARKGILIKSGDLLEICRKISVVVLDKTGTITHGKMQVSRVEPVFGRTEREILGYAASAECSSSHPIARAIVTAAEQKGISVICGGSGRQYSGLGVEDLQDGKVVHVGNIRYMQEQGIPLPDGGANPDRTDGDISVLVAVDQVVYGSIHITDTLRPEAGSVISVLREMGISRIEILTGDSPPIAGKIAEACGVPPDAVYSGMYPKDKEEHIAELQKKEVVCFVGDGTNDGPALARADLGIGVGSHEDTIALQASGVILMRDNLSLLPEFIHLGRRAERIIIMNAVIALGLNLLLICGAAYGLFSPALGAIGHQVATLLVLGNSARMAYPAGKNQPHICGEACSHHRSSVF